MAVVAILLLVVVAAGSSEAGAKQARIVFWSDRDRYEGDIFIMDQDGSNLTNLTKDCSLRAFDPEVSPDGRHIAFSGLPDRAGGLEVELWVMDIDGSHPEMVTDSRTIADCRRPSWSPDGSRLVFSAFSEKNEEGPGCGGMDDLAQCTHDLHIVDLGSRDIVRLTWDPVPGHFPAWSPDGRRIAFVQDDATTPYDSGGLWVVDVDGTNLCQLTAAGLAANKPSWSPDGSRILYSRLYTSELMVINADGAGSPVNLFNDGRWGAQPAWSPDGSKIAYLYYNEIWLMDAESTISVQLTHDPDEEDRLGCYNSISWAPGAIVSVVGSGSWGRLKAWVKD